MEKHSLLARACICILALARVVPLSAQTFTTLYSFDRTDGAYPSKLIQGTDGNFYGTTTTGGANTSGTIFQITPDGTLTTLQSFEGARGGLPMIQASNGTFYGTADPIAYSIVPGGTLVTLATVGPSAGPLILASDGNFYGTTSGDIPFTYCSANCGTIFELTPAGTLTTLYTFSPTNSTGVSPLSGPGALVQGTDGSFYGGAGFGGYDNCGIDQPDFCGGIFKFTLPSELTVLYDFCSQPGCPDGFAPSGLVQGTDGNFYGTTASGGIPAGGGIGSPYGPGTVFKITPQSVFTTLHSFVGTDGNGPASGVIQASDGNFYGTTATTIFRITSEGAFTVLYGFGATSAPSFNGLTLGSDGIFYGTTTFGGVNSLGSVFSFSIGLGGTTPSTSSLELSPATVAVGSAGPVVMTVTVSPTAGSGTPTGVISFYNGSTQVASANLTNGTATYNYDPSSLAVGTYQMIVSYSGDGTYAASTSSQTLTVSSSPPAATPSFSPAAGTYNSPQIVTISDATTGATIYFTTDGTTPTTNSEVYNGPITVNSTQTINAIAGGTNLSNSAVATATYTIALTPDYQIAVKPSTLTIVAGQSGTATFTVTPMNGFDSEVDFTCTGLPAEATCTFNPTSVTPTNSNPLTSTLTITTTAASAALWTPMPSSPRLFYAFMIPGLGIVFGFVGRRKLTLHGPKLLGTFVLLLLLAALISCGGNGTATTPPNSGTPPGTNSVTVTASTGGSAAVSHNATLTITISQ